MGRLTRDPEVRYSGKDNQMAVAKYNLAVDRRFKKQGEKAEADFINCVAFGKLGEFAEKYFKQGTKIVVEGRIQTGSYIDKETGKKVYTTDVIVDNQEFAESKKASGESSGGQTGYSQPAPSQEGNYDWMNIPDGVNDPNLPFN